MVLPLLYYDIGHKVRQGGKAHLGQRLSLERKEVWDFSWSNDTPDLFAIMEKTRMYIFRGTDPEVSEAYL